MAKKIRLVKCICIASIIIILNTINSFAGNVLDNSQASTILSMPIVKILIVGFAGIIIVSLLYNVSQETENYSKSFAKKDDKIENDNYYINEYNKKNKDTSINQEIIDKANEEEKPKYREEYIRESKLDQGLLEEITQLYNEENEENEEKNDIKDIKDLKLEDDIKNDKEEENEELETDKTKEEKDEEEKLKEEPKKTRERKKAEETKNDNLAEDFLNNLDMTMRKG